MIRKYTRKLRISVGDKIFKSIDVNNILCITDTFLQCLNKFKHFT